MPARWLTRSSLLVASALTLALSVRIAFGYWLQKHTDYRAIQARLHAVASAQQAFGEQTQLRLAPLPSATTQAPSDQRVQSVISLGAGSVGTTRTTSQGARARTSQPTSTQWVEIAPRMFARPDRSLRVDLRGVSDLAPFARGLRAQLAPEGGFVITSLDQQGYLSGAGIAVGDRLVSLNDLPTLSLDQLLGAYFRARFADAVLLRFLRGQRDYQLRAELLR